MKAFAATALLALLVGCSGQAPATSAPRPNLTVSNGTTLTVTLVVNGQRVGDFPPSGAGPKIDVASLPPLPWTVEARSPSGRLLTSMVVGPGEVQSMASGAAIVMGRVDLSCGRLTIFAGDVAPSGPAPPPSPGNPGDCAP